MRFLIVRAAVMRRSRLSRCSRLDRAGRSSSTPSPEPPPATPSPTRSWQSMYRAALLNTSRQATIATDGTAYVKTGDIRRSGCVTPARRSARMCSSQNDPPVRLLRGIIARMAKNIHVDPYANAFTLDTGSGNRSSNSIARLSDRARLELLESRPATSRCSPATFARRSIRRSTTMEREQDHPRTRATAPRARQQRQGRTGQLHRDDLDRFSSVRRRLQYNYLIPSEMSRSSRSASSPTSRARLPRLINRLREGAARRSQPGIQTYGIVYPPKYGYIYAYEVDGLGHTNLMDDANIPSLLSAPYLGYSKSDDVYTNTRRSCSPRQPDYYTGKFARGIGARTHRRPLGVAAGAAHARLHRDTDHERRTCSRNSGQRSRRPSAARIVRSERSEADTRRRISAGRTRSLAST